MTAKRFLDEETFKKKPAAFKICIAAVRQSISSRLIIDERHIRFVERCLSKTIDR